MVFASSLILTLALFGASFHASPLSVVERQAVTTATSAASSTTTGALVETTIDGKLTTVPIAAPTDSSSTGTSTSGRFSTSTSSASSPTGSVSEGAPEIPSAIATSCKNPIDQPICQPHSGQQLLAGNTYIIQWSTSAWAANTSIIVGLQYTNDSSQVAWMSPPYVTQRGVATVTIDEKWLEGWNARNYTFVWNTYMSDPSRPQNSVRQKAFDVVLSRKPVEHLPPPPHSKMPSKESLYIALPVTLGALFIVAVGLFVGMRSHRRIGLGNVMGRRRGYTSGRSRRQRLGLKKGAIRLEDRDPAAGNVPSPAQYRDEDEITTAPDQPNAFRREIEEQKASK